jgi:hypothetical protein
MNRFGAIVLLTACFGFAGCGGGAGQGGTPIIQLSQTTLSFAANFGIAYTPVLVPVNVTNTGAGTLTFAAMSDSPWLIVTPGSGTAPQSLSVSVAPGNLAVGAYTGHVTVTASGAQVTPAAITVTFDVVTAPANAPFWAQWGADPQHAGMVSVAAQGAVNQLANIVYDPFVAQEQAENAGAGGDGDLTVHYQAPLTDGNDV